MKNHDITEIDAKVKHQTASAVMVENLKGEDVWLSKSLIEVDGDGTIQLPEWLAERKGLV